MKNKSIDMKINIINNLINNYTWSTTDNKVYYRFENGKDLWINDINHLTYIVNSVNGKIIIQIGTDKKYVIEYVNDFLIELHNEQEKFRLLADSN
jgi:hypothetical protein